ncbi:ABC transporter ATP-binding protein [Micromonospora sp. KC207]|uniref:ABC transporter ATP-binding protein n=1 Tax=Micromonospora sp. KC207 TaxID=2530377 RepID=UPI00104E3E4C|nr:ABC transporter ATP-binding protein [Micromonospora sp. KC207]TDC57824.1 ABC transporter ATP-binding protein [Micromonospora sp. KC207]
MAEARIRLHGLTRTFDGGVGVRGVDLDVGAGEIHALVGLNGAGKSTLMRLLLGMLRPESGTVLLDGRPLGSAPWSRLGHLIETPLAYGELTGRANLMLAARLHGVPASAAAPMVERVLTELNLHPYAAIRARRMSSGSRQRLGLAAALQHDPDIIVLDEPTNALDPAGVISLREALVRRAAAGAGVLVSSHHLDEVARVADRITVINAGRTIGALNPHGVDIEREFFALVRSDDERTAA